MTVSDKLKGLKVKYSVSLYCKYKHPASLFIHVPANQRSPSAERLLMSVYLGQRQKLSNGCAASSLHVEHLSRKHKQEWGHTQPSTHTNTHTHTENTNTHTENTNTHTENTNTHRRKTPTHTHTENTNTHTNTHTENTNTHTENTNTHTNTHTQKLLWKLLKLF